MGDSLWGSQSWLPPAFQPALVWLRHLPADVRSRAEARLQAESLPHMALKILQR